LFSEYKLKNNKFGEIYVKTKTEFTDLSYCCRSQYFIIENILKLFFLQAEQNRSDLHYTLVGPVPPSATA
jgi:hypothetical protein